MTDKELDEAALEFAHTDTAIGHHWSLMHPDRFNAFKSGAKYQGERVFNKVLEELRSKNALWLDSFADHLSKPEIKESILNGKA